MDETFLVLDASRMHAEMLVENREIMKSWERFMRERLYPDARFGLMTRMLFSHPEQSKTSARLNQAFPILEGSRYLKKKSTLFDKNVNLTQFKDLDTVQIHFNTFFQTLHHGIVNLTGISVLTSPSMRNVHQLRIGTLAPTDEDPNGGMTLSMTNTGTSPTTPCLFLVTMLVPFTGCRHCSKREHPSPTDPTRAHMYKCGRCWALLRYPIWYCSVECQRADHQRHSTEEGCGKIHAYGNARPQSK